MNIQPVPFIFGLKNVEDFIVTRQQFSLERRLHLHLVDILDQHLHVLLVPLEFVLAHSLADVAQHFLLVLLVVLEFMLCDRLYLQPVHQMEVAVLGLLHTAVLHKAVAAIRQNQWIHVGRFVAVDVHRVSNTTVVAFLFGFPARLEHLLKVAVELDFRGGRNVSFRTGRIVLCFDGSVVAMLNQPNYLVAALELLLKLFLVGLPAEVQRDIEVGDTTEPTELSEELFRRELGWQFRYRQCSVLEFERFRRNRVLLLGAPHQHQLT